MVRCLAAGLLALPLGLGGCGLGQGGADPLPPASAAAAALHWSVETDAGRFLGSATAIAPDRLLTNRHVVGEGGGVVARRAGVAVAVSAIRRADGADAAVLHLTEAAAVPGAPVAAAPRPGEPLAVAGARGGVPQTGAGVAQAGEAPSGLALARLPAAPGFSGGPVVDGAGRLAGIVVAALEPDARAARALAMGPGLGPAAPRQVLFLPIGRVLDDPHLMGR